VVTGAGLTGTVSAAVLVPPRTIEIRELPLEHRWDEAAGLSLDVEA